MSQPFKNIIEVENLTCAYGELVIVNDISFGVQSGEIFVILGGSGCGKSTVLKHLIGLFPPAQGKIFIDGDDIGSAHGSDKLDILRRIGVMYQTGALFGSMTLLENVRLPLEEFTSMPLDAMNYVARMKLSLVGLEGSAEKMPSELSGGMIKRGAIARAMALDPKILFLDEPSAGLDPITSAELDELIRSLSRSLGVTFVIVTHELQSIFSIADRIIMLDKGTKGIIAEGDPRKLRDESDIPLVRSFFHRELADKTSNATPVMETI
ncbi:phospholipid/cholesterol/gamma-HCH transport system ATP-binding protein [Maridesulfovibrio ferrireducens]|uniref:Phospholipid/cholesterol/gamma-HCH transport system ATP-binding protein n=1 Tax=Maridesulfovibrio ferrireducens TaxID=246191 RepID=A0A1G9F4C8_9BACT|nr:ATP-binding cassette domain-containing protein [Maridesulfovibrio ferrireducens]SDK83264.1 phospholipid/cholesterol/gamma-HCH transport system ATP-binding protein [Maridesulfovibrio ferrireducens]